MKKMARTVVSLCMVALAQPSLCLTETEVLLSQVLLTNILRWEGGQDDIRPVTGDGESSDTEQTRDHSTVQHNYVTTQCN